MCATRLACYPLSPRVNLLVVDSSGQRFGEENLIDCLLRFVAPSLRRYINSTFSSKYVVLVKLHVTHH